MKHASNQCCRMLLRRSYHSSTSSSDQSLWRNKRKGCVLETNREDEQNRETKSPTLLTHMQNQPWTKENNTSRRPKENSSRGQDGVKKDQAGARSSDLCAGRRRRPAAILFHFSAASAGKEDPGEPPGAAGAGEARMGSRRSPRTQKIPQKKNFPGRRVGT